MYKVLAPNGQFQTHKRTESQNQRKRKLIKYGLD
jgi:hypothetical protein